MHSILKRSAALIASAATLLGGGMLMAGTAQADGIGLPVMTIHPAASTSYPKELVNGDFQTFGNRIVDKRSGGRQYLSFVDGNGMAMEGSSERPWAKVDGWDAVKFGWKSNDSVSGHRGIVEVQRFRTAVKGSTGNVWGEIAAATQGKYLYQDIDTANTSDAMYTVRLKHASRNKDARDSMQVLVGAPGREKPVTMRRTIANAGDKAGEESTTITSTGTGQDDQWDTYEGTVLVPRGQDVTRFTFKSVADSNSAGRPDSAEGNLIDDVVFTKAYQLTYDANGGVKTRTSQIDYTTGGETRGKVKTVRDSPAPPAGQEKIVNGDFEYSGTGAGLSDSPFNYVSLSRKSYYYKDSRNVNHRVALPAGFDAKRFAWKSDQTGKDLGNPPYEQAGDVQVWNRYDGSNHYAELTAAQAGSAIYQDIDTESDSDVQYIVSLRHASLNASHLDSMQVLIGAPGHETPVTMTRVTANGYGDKVGESSDTIATRVSNPKPADREDSDHTGQWETYTGTVTVPAGRPVTRFTFRNVSSKSAWNGNLIDDIAFTKARRLDYDANGGTKAQASQIGYRTDATQGAVETVASKTLPTELVNGSFDYLLDGGWDTISPVGRGGYADDRGWGRFTSVDPASGEYIQNAGQNPATFDSTGKWVKWPGFDAAKFGWASDQKGGQPQGGVGLTDRPNAVELQQDSVTGNTYAEIVGSERGKAILQKIDTQHDSDTVYTVRFDHASLSKEHADSMQVLVNGKPVTMTRVTSNKAGDEQGWTGTSITTHATNTNRFQHDGQWATYEGKVTIPANTPVSTFTFKALNAVDPTKGNLIDNLTFKIAYRLSYDANGGTGQVPSRTETGRTETAASRMNGTVRLAADRDTEPESGTTTDDRKVLTDTIARQDDGTSQRTITRSDGSVQVQTIADTGAVSGCQVYYPAGARITLATAKADSDCWDSSQISKTNRTFYGWSANTDANDKDVPVADTMDRATLDANAETQITMPARAKTVYALWAINPTLTYDVNAPAGTNAPVAPASKTVPYNTAATDTSGWVAGDAGKITGYTFQGWYTGKDGAAKYDFTAKLTSDATVYAKWTANACTVKYDAGGGQGSMPDQKFTFGVPQNLTRNTFTRSGWAFTGWKRADTGDAYQDGQQVANLICTPNGGAPFVAQWTPNAAAINYNANPPAGRTPGGQGTANWTGHTGDTQAIGANGWTVDGYTFIGWNTSADGKGTAYAPGTTWIANGTLTLYAQWTPGQAGLTYDGNGATGGKTDPQPGKTDEKINVRDNGFTRDGYMFVTWNTQAGCKGKAVDPGDEWTLQGSGTLYACWAGTAQTLAYHGNGATGGNTAVQSGKTGDELTTNANGFTRDGYTFVRWDTAKDGSGTAYGEGKNGVSQYTMKPAGNDLYAIWKANPASIVYRNGYPNTTGSTPDTTGSTGDTVTVSQNGFDRPGYTFTGWSTSKRGDPSLNPGDKHTLEPGTTTVWAQWKANPAHLVYNSNVGGIGSETRTVDGVVDQTVKTLGNPFDRPGYTFSGWNTQADGKGKAYDPGADYTLTANDKSTPKNTSVLYAQWTINKVTLKFDPNGGVGGYPSINTDAFGSVTIPKDAKEPKVTRPGFRFTGWSLKKTPDKDETLLTPGKDTVSMPAEGEVAVYAQWEPAMTTLPFTGGNAQIPTIWLWAGLAFLIIAAGAFSPMIRLRMGAGSKGRHAGTPTIGRHSR
ncbi:InlB B-repeat-containing protein [Bifidobacterium longum]|uniref:InlB B-repeat-containing protein n=1 Tax=Bifidobacterium longum TaxID=216816 RepID=UPI000E469102|nr:InlB B-repeat-containing protein [Bifidobacterium longum]RGX01177.1 hypothetical protein DWV38_08110 [Bifidobacterium longum]